MTQGSARRALPMLCPHHYSGAVWMTVTPCSPCRTGWDRALGRCTIETGAEDLPDAGEVATCPIQDHCQHQAQSEGPCLVRRKGMICESALVEGGMSPDEAIAHPLSFNATLMP